MLLTRLYEVLGMYDVHTYKYINRFGQSEFYLFSPFFFSIWYKFKVEFFLINVALCKLNIINYLPLFSIYSNKQFSIKDKTNIDWNFNF